MWEMLGINKAWDPEYVSNPDIQKSKGTVSLFDQKEFLQNKRKNDSMDDNGIIYIPHFC